jgi:hypothetical protein
MNDWLLRMGKFILLIGVLLIVAGCLPSQLKAATVTANSIAEFADATHDALAFSYKLEQEECVHDAKEKSEAVSCVASVREKYKAAWSYYRSLRRSWILLASAIQSAKLINDPNDPRLAPALAALIEANKGFDDVSNALGGAK